MSLHRNLPSLQLQLERLLPFAHAVGDTTSFPKSLHPPWWGAAAAASGVTPPTDIACWNDVVMTAAWAGAALSYFLIRVRLPDHVN